MEREWLMDKINGWNPRIPVDHFASSRWGPFGIAALAVVGFLLRIWVGGRGHNFDFESFLTILARVDVGGNVYAENLRYNYGPIWFYILQTLNAFAGIFNDPARAMPVLLSGSLALVDVGIYIVLLRTFGLFAAALFILNPVSIIITGYHRQFDNLAILMALLAVRVIGDGFAQPLNRRKMGGLLLLGLSMVTKHLFFAFPLWLAVKQRGWKEKLVILALPTLIFLLSFAPYWSGGSQGVIDNVFLYEPHVEFQNAPFWHWFLPNIIRFFTSPTAIFLAALIIGAFILRRETGLVSLLFYTAILVVTSPTIVNQYLAIVIPFISVYMNFFFLLYTITATWHLLVDKNGLRLQLPLGERLGDVITLSTIMAVLTIGLIWKPTWKAIINVLKREMIVQKNEMRPSQSDEGTP